MRLVTSRWDQADRGMGWWIKRGRPCLLLQLPKLPAPSSPCSNTLGGLQRAVVSATGRAVQWSSSGLCLGGQHARGQRGGHRGAVLGRVFGVSHMGALLPVCQRFAQPQQEGAYQLHARTCPVSPCGTGRCFNLLVGAQIKTPLTVSSTFYAAEVLDRLSALLLLFPCRPGCLCIPLVGAMCWK